MYRRIIAWVLLIGFILLLLNIVWFRFQWKLSIAIYAIIMFYFLFTQKKRKQDS